MTGTVDGTEEAADGSGANLGGGVNVSDGPETTALSLTEFKSNA
jgi:hypothetical protein